MSKSKLIIVTGTSGSGKTTVARQLIKRGEVAFDSKINPKLYQFVDTGGNVATSVKLNDDDWRSTYKWSLNREELEELLRRHSEASRVFLCGRANLFQYWDIADRVFLLKVDKETLLTRLNNESRDNLFAKDASTQQRLVSDLEKIQNKIIEKGAIVIEATKPIDDVVNQVLREA